MSEIIPSPSQQIAPVAGPLDRNPAAVYLASLSSPGGRRTQRQALNVIAGLVSSGQIADCLAFPWESLRYQHTAAIRAQLPQHYKTATANRMLAALRGVLKQAWRLGLMTAEEYQRAADVQNLRGASLPAGRELSPAEVAALMESCGADPGAGGARDAAVIALLYGAGLRREEAAGLDLADFTPASGQMVIRGKGNKERTVYLKNGSADALADWLTVRGGDPGPLFYPINKGGKIQRRRLTTQAIYNLLAKRGEEAGVHKFSPHDMRRTFVSDLLDAGADIVTVSKMAGHANVSTTARYDRRGEQTKQKAAGLLHVPYHQRKKESPDNG